MVVFENLYLCREHGGIQVGAMENLKCNVLKWVRMGFISISKYTKLVGLSSSFHESIKKKRKSGQKTGGAMQDSRECQRTLRKPACKDRDSVLDCRS